jgi:hypothetical protein
MILSINQVEGYKSSIIAPGAFYAMRSKTKSRICFAQARPFFISSSVG